MIEHAANLLSRLTVEFSLILVLLLLLRPWLRRAYGAACAYASWILLPLLLAVAQLPASKPAQFVQVLVARELPVRSTLATVPIPEVADWATPLLTLWFIGVLACCFMLAWRQWRFMRGLQRHADQAQWLSPVGSGPALVGVWRPLVCLPADFEQRFSSEQQRLILAHEEVHRVRRDNLWNLLAALMAALQWFNPLAWLGLRLMRVDQELSCDAAVLRESAQLADYAHALLNAQPSMALAGGIHSSWRSAHPLVERISMLKLHANARRRAGLLTLSFIGVLAAGTVHAWRAGEPTNSKPMVMLSLSITSTDVEDGKLNKQRASPKMLVELGQTASLTLGASPEHPSQKVSVELTPTQLADGTYKVKTHLSRGEPLKRFADTELTVREGELTTFDSGTDSDGKNMLIVLTAVARQQWPKGAVKQQP